MTPVSGFSPQVSPPAPPPPRRAALTALQVETIDLFVQLSRALGQPRSYAEIYGLLFITPDPLTMDDLIARLHLSKGSASQGLKFLRNIGAVREVQVPGERRMHYQATAELRNLAGRFLRDQIVPHLDNGLKRLDRISALTKDLPAKERVHASARLKLLQSWEKNGRRVLPIVARILG